MDVTITSAEPISVVVTCDNPDIIEVIDAQPIEVVVSITKDGKDGEPGQDAENNTLEMVRAENPIIEGNIDANGNTIENLRDAEAAQEPATLNQVQAAEQNAKDYSDTSITQLIDNAANDANTLKKLSDKINAINAIVGGSDPDGNSIIDTVAELLVVFSTYPEGSDIATILAGKVNSSDIVNNLNQVVAGKVLDAAQGKVLKDLIDALTVVVNSKWSAVDASDAVKGIMKMYGTLGSNIDGTISQSIITDEFLKKFNKNRFIFQPAASITGVTGENVICSFKISGGAYENLADGFSWTIFLSKSVTASTIDYKGYIGTSQNLLSNQIRRFITNAGTRGVDIKADYVINSGLLNSTMQFTANVPSGAVTQNSTVNTPIAVNMDNHLWFTITGNPSVITEVVGILGSCITPLK